MGCGWKRPSPALLMCVEGSKDCKLWRLGRGSSRDAAQGCRGCCGLEVTGLAVCCEEKNSLLWNNRNAEDKETFIEGNQARKVRSARRPWWCSESGDKAVPRRQGEGTSTFKIEAPMSLRKRVLGLGEVWPAFSWSNDGILKRMTGSSLCLWNYLWGADSQRFGWMGWWEINGKLCCVFLLQVYSSCCP